MVVRKTQSYLHKSESKRPVQMESYFTTATLLGFILIIIGVIVFAILSQFSCGRYLLIRYPKFFSGGFFSKQEDPPEDLLEAYRYSFTLRGKGWSKRVTEKITKDKIDKEVVVKVEGSNPGYGITSIGAALCAILVLTEREQMPRIGGVYTPGAVFGKTTLVDKLNRHGVNFEVLTEIVQL